MAVPLRKDFEGGKSMEQNNQPNLLVFGILSIVFSSIVGIILGAIGRSKGKKYIQAGGTLTGSAKVGYILSLVGLILGIIVTVYIIIMAIVAAGAAASYSGSF